MAYHTNLNIYEHRSSYIICEYVMNFIIYFSLFKYILYIVKVLLNYLKHILLILYFRDIYHSRLFSNQILRFLYAIYSKLSMN